MLLNKADRYLSKKTLAIIVFIAILIPWQVVYACSFDERFPRIVCEINTELLQNENVCIDEDCLLWVSPSEVYYSAHTINRGEETVGYIWKDFIEIIDGSDFEAINQVCVEDFEDYVQVFEQRFQDWFNNRRGFEKIEKYSIARDIEYIELRSNLFDCFDFEYERVGDWLISDQDFSYYCDMNTACEFRIFIIPFIFYTFTHPSINTAPYLIIFTLFAFFLIRGNLFLYRKKAYRDFLMPSKITFLFYLLSSPFLYSILFRGHVTYFIWLIIGIYILASLVNYLRKKNQMTVKVKPIDTKRKIDEISPNNQQHPPRN